MPVKTKKQNRLESNLAELRKILSVDTLMEEVNQEEAIEFLDAIEVNIQREKEDMEDEITTLKNQLDDRDTTIKELEEKVEELEDEPDYENEWQLTGSLKWSADNMQDQDVMEALGKAYEKLTPYQIVDRLKVA